MRGGRDGAQPSGRGVQLLQKSQDSPVEPTHRSRVFGDRPGPGFDRFGRDKDPSRRDYPAHTTRQPMSATETRSRDHYNPLGLSNFSPVDGRNQSARRLSTGPEPLPPPLTTDGTRPDGRPMPPHLASLQVPPPQRGPPSAAPSEATSGGLGSAHPITQSPAASFASISPRIPDTPLHSSTMPLVDIDEVRKAAMHSAAERAKLRRQQEEEEREKERDRARRKAAELEAKMKEAEEKSAKEKTEAESMDKEEHATPATESQVNYLFFMFFFHSRVLTGHEI